MGATANPLREPQRRVELINALIATEWKFVSQWFEEKMRNEVEHILQKSLHNFLSPTPYKKLPIISNVHPMMKAKCFVTVSASNVLLHMLNAKPWLFSI